MIVFLLLVIVAILLFGAGAVLGLVGLVIGGLAGLLVLGYALAVFDISGETITGTFLVVLMILFVFSVSQPKPTQAKPKAPEPLPKAPELPADVREAIAANRKLTDEFNEKVKRKREEGGR